jgi:putative ABC transport system permease protein
MYWNELRLSFRGLARSRGFLVTSVLVLSLGLGANFVLFNAIYALLWQPLPYHQSGRLVTVSTSLSDGHSRFAISLQQAAVVPERVPSVLTAGLFMQKTFQSSTTFVLMRGAEPVHFSAIPVNSEYFRALEIQPLAGRFFGEEEDRGENAETHAVISESSWRTYFGADRAVINQVFPFEHDGKRQQVRVVGIAPDSAILRKSAEGPQLLISLPWLVPETHGVLFFYTPVFRLKPSVTLAQASTQMQQAFRSVVPVAAFHYSAVPLRSLVAPTDRRAMLLLYGGSCLLLLLTFANVAGMFLVRYLERARDIAVRMAVGAPLSRVWSLNFQEALLVCATGTAVAFAVVRILRPLALRFLPQAQNLGTQPLTMGWVMAGVGVLTCVAMAYGIATAPIWIIRKTELASVLCLGGPAKTGRRRWWQMALVTGQIAIATLLLAVAGLLGRSFTSALHVDPGFDPRHVLTFHATLSATPITTLSATSDTTSAGYELSGLISGLPGVQHVGFSADPVFGGDDACIMSSRSGNFEPSDPAPNLHLISGTYLQTIGARLLVGRIFTDAEVQNQARVAVINRSAARLFFPGEVPLGRTLHLGFGDLHSSVVGVIEDMREKALDSGPGPTVYIPYLAAESGSLDFVVRTGGNPATYVSGIRGRLNSWDRPVFIDHARPLEDVAESTVQMRLMAITLMGGFALLGLLVSSVGLYGTMSAEVQQRRREIGVRMALGATVGAVIRQLLFEVLRMVGIGLALGLAGVCVSAPLLEHHLYGVHLFDIRSFALAAMLLGIAAVLALLPPALRAARVDPVEVLKAA